MANQANIDKCEKLQEQMAALPEDDQAGRERIQT